MKFNSFLTILILAAIALFFIWNKDAIVNLFKNNNKKEYVDTPHPESVKVDLSSNFSGYAKQNKPA